MRFDPHRLVDDEEFEVNFKIMNAFLIMRHRLDYLTGSKSEYIEDVFNWRR